MIEREIAKHSIRIEYDGTDDPFHQLVCHGDQESACWWAIVGFTLEPYGQCIFADWYQAQCVVTGAIEIPLELVHWDDSGIDMRLVTEAPMTNVADITPRQDLKAALKVIELLKLLKKDDRFTKCKSNSEHGSTDSSCTCSELGIALRQFGQ